MIFDIPSMQRRMGVVIFVVCFVQKYGLLPEISKTLFFLQVSLAKNELNTLLCIQKESEIISLLHFFSFFMSESICL